MIITGLYVSCKCRESRTVVSSATHTSINTLYIDYLIVFMSTYQQFHVCPFPFFVSPICQDHFEGISSNMKLQKQQFSLYKVNSLMSLFLALSTTLGCVYKQTSLILQGPTQPTQFVRYEWRELCCVVVFLEFKVVCKALLL